MQETQTQTQPQPAAIHSVPVAAVRTLEGLHSLRAILPHWSPTAQTIGPALEALRDGATKDVRRWASQVEADREAFERDPRDDVRDRAADALRAARDAVSALEDVRDASEYSDLSRLSEHLQDALSGLEAATDETSEGLSLCEDGDPADALEELERSAVGLASALFVFEVFRGSEETRDEDVRAALGHSPKTRAALQDALGALETEETVSRLRAIRTRLGL